MCVSSMYWKSLFCEVGEVDEAECDYDKGILEYGDPPYNAAVFSDTLRRRRGSSSRSSIAVVVVVVGVALLLLQSETLWVYLSTARHYSLAFTIFVACAAACNKYGEGHTTAPVVRANER